MQPITIKECSNVILAEFERNQYSPNTMRTKIIAFNCIDRWFWEHGTSCYDKDIARAFEEYVYGRFQRSEIAVGYSLAVKIIVGVIYMTMI